MDISDNTYGPSVGVLPQTNLAHRVTVAKTPPAYHVDITVIGSAQHVENDERIAFLSHWVF